MNSTSTSEPISNRADRPQAKAVSPKIETRALVAECRNLDLAYRLRLIRSHTLRDMFIKITRDPIGFVTQRRDNLHVLKNVSLKIHQGDRIGILGLNGTGKTTLCRCFAKVYTPNQGQVIVHGHTRAVFDTSVGIYPELTGRENAKLLAEFMYPEVTAQERARLVVEALDFSELGTFADAPFKTYSNGMQARLCLSMVSCRSPDLLILDEVFDGADHLFREKISKRIVKLIENSGAVMFVSHSPGLVSGVCNRVIVINDGAIAFDGSVNDGIEFFSKIGPRKAIG